MRLVGFSHYVATGGRGTLGLLELVSSSCSASSRSSLLPIMLSPSPYSESVYSRETSAAFPSGVVTFSFICPAFDKISESPVVVWLGSGSVSFEDVSAGGNGVLRSSALACFSVVSVARILSCSLRIPSLFGLCCKEFCFGCLLMSHLFEWVWELPPIGGILPFPLPAVWFSGLVIGSVGWGICLVVCLRGFSSISCC